MPGLFDAWPEEYEHWFQTPIGQVVKKYEMELILDLLRPSPESGFWMRAAGPGYLHTTFWNKEPGLWGSIFPCPCCERLGPRGAPALSSCRETCVRLPFREGAFEKTVSITALEFIEDAKQAIEELFRVTKSKGTIVVATLNRLSPWAAQRKEKGKEGHSLFSRVFFRSPEEMAALASQGGVLRTAVHFKKEEDPRRALEIEEEGKRKGLLTGAFLAVRWEKP